MSILKKFPILSNLILIILLSVLIGFLTLFLIDRYTKHDQKIVVPELRSKQLVDAENALRSIELRSELVDSVYREDLAPGAVVEMLPAPGNSVKPGRIIFLTINARSPKKNIIPEVKDLSERQALAILHSLGFENVETRYVAGDFSDLSAGIETIDGRPVHAGDRMPVNSSLALLVVKVNPYEVLPDSSLIDNSFIQRDSTATPIASEQEDSESDNETWW